MPTELERRVAAIEKQLSRLQLSHQPVASTGREWVDDLYGKFSNDPVFEQAMNLGRKYRRSKRLPVKRKAKT